MYPIFCNTLSTYKFIFYYATDVIKKTHQIHDTLMIHENKMNATSIYILLSQFFFSVKDAKNYPSSFFLLQNASGH